MPFAKAIIAPLTVALAAAFWARFIHRSLTGEGLFYYVGVDWGMFWAAAHAALGSGPKDVYNLHLLGQYVAPLRHYYGPQAAFLKVNPVPYPPIFIALFIPFTFVSPP